MSRCQKSCRSQDSLLASARSLRAPIPNYSFHHLPAGGNLDNYELALRFISESDAIDISVVGMGSAEEVERNAAAAESLTPLTDEDFAECEKIRQELGSRFCRRCGYCSPCTAGININMCFLLNNYLHKYNLAAV